MHYNIKDIERLTGIKAHTIRMWEKRYNLVEPSRSDTNIRYYTDSDLKKLLNTATLNKSGFKISRVAEMSDQEIKRHLLELTENARDLKVFLEGLTLAMIEVDEERFEKVLNSCILKFGFEETMVNVVYPFFKRVGVMWLTGTVSPGQEHFISNLIRQKLIVAIDSRIEPLKEGYKKFLLFLPETEMHELGLLFYNYIIKNAGHKVIYLGQSVPILDVVEIAKRNKVDYLLSSFLSYGSKEEAIAVIKELQDKDVQIEKFFVLDSTLFNDYKFPWKNMVQINDYQQFKGYIKTLEAQFSPN
ncbi:MAG: MerR family transcriptional regulator [Luteibaculaceae bacterium]